jgi:hypothetical protein
MMNLLSRNREDTTVGAVPCHMHINGCLSQHYTHNISELYMAGNVLGSSEMFFLVLQFLPPPLNDFAAFMMIEAVALTPQPVAQTVS